jgi:hypothetical protein
LLGHGGRTFWRPCYPNNPSRSPSFEAAKHFNKGGLNTETQTLIKEISRRLEASDLTKKEQERIIFEHLGC